MLNLSGYAQQVGNEMGKKEKLKFWSELDEVVESIPREKRVVIGFQWACWGREQR